jgi:hypothetical protein
MSDDLTEDIFLRMEREKAQWAMDLSAPIQEQLRKDVTKVIQTTPHTSRTELYNIPMDYSAMAGGFPKGRVPQNFRQAQDALVFSQFAQIEEQTIQAFKSNPGLSAGDIFHDKVQLYLEALGNPYKHPTSGLTAKEPFFGINATYYGFRDKINQGINPPAIGSALEGVADPNDPMFRERFPTGQFGRPVPATRSIEVGGKGGSGRQYSFWGSTMWDRIAKGQQPTYQRLPPWGAKTGFVGGTDAEIMGYNMSLYDQERADYNAEQAKFQLANAPGKWLGGHPALSRLEWGRDPETGQAISRTRATPSYYHTGYLLGTPEGQDISPQLDTMMKAREYMQGLGPNSRFSMAVASIFSNTGKMPGGEQQAHVWYKEALDRRIGGLAGASKYYAGNQEGQQDISLSQKLWARRNELAVVRQDFEMGFSTGRGQVFRHMKSQAAAEFEASYQAHMAQIKATSVHQPGQLTFSLRGDQLGVPYTQTYQAVMQDRAANPHEWAQRQTGWKTREQQVAAGSITAHNTNPLLSDRSRSYNALGLPVGGRDVMPWEQQTINVPYAGGVRAYKPTSYSPELNQYIRQSAAYLRGTMGEGVSIVESTTHPGTKIRVSDNPEWYKNLYEEGFTRKGVLSALDKIASSYPDINLPKNARTIPRLVSDILDIGLRGGEGMPPDPMVQAHFGASQQRGQPMTLPPEGLYNQPSLGGGFRGALSPEINEWDAGFTSRHVARMSGLNIGGFPSNPQNLEYLSVGRQIASQTPQAGYATPQQPPTWFPGETTPSAGVIAANAGYSWIDQEARDPGVIDSTAMQPGERPGVIPDLSLGSWFKDRPEYEAGRTALAAGKHLIFSKSPGWGKTAMIGFAAISGDKFQAGLVISPQTSLNQQLMKDLSDMGISAHFLPGKPPYGSPQTAIDDYNARTAAYINELEASYEPVRDAQGNIESYKWTGRKSVMAVVTPEKASIFHETRPGRAMARAQQAAAGNVIVDEAQEMFGGDRHMTKNVIRNALKNYPGMPIMAVGGSLNKLMIENLVAQMGGPDNVSVIDEPLDMRHINIEAEIVSAKGQGLQIAGANIAKRQGPGGVIYAHSTRNVAGIANRIKQMIPERTVYPYHKGGIEGDIENPILTPEQLEAVEGPVMKEGIPYDASVVSSKAGVLGLNWRVRTASGGTRGVSDVGLVGPHGFSDTIQAGLRIRAARDPATGQPLDVKTGTFSIATDPELLRRWGDMAKEDFGNLGATQVAKAFHHALGKLDTVSPNWQTAGDEISGFLGEALEQLNPKISRVRGTTVFDWLQEAKMIELKPFKRQVGVDASGQPQFVNDSRWEFKETQNISDTAEQISRAKFSSPFERKLAQLEGRPVPEGNLSFNVMRRRSGEQLHQEYNLMAKLLQESAPLGKEFAGEMIREGAMAWKEGGLTGPGGAEDFVNKGRRKRNQGI